MRVIAWILVAAGMASFVWAIFDPSFIKGERWMAWGVFAVGMILLILTKKLRLDAGEVLFYKGSAHAGEGSAIKSQSKTALKLAITSKGLRYGEYYGGDQALVPYDAIVDVERLGPLSVRVNMRGEAGEAVSLKLQFAVVMSGRFLNAIQQNGVTVIDRTKVAGPGGMDV